MVEVYKHQITRRRRHRESTTPCPSGQAPACRSPLSLPLLWQSAPPAPSGRPQGGDRHPTSGDPGRALPLHRLPAHLPPLPGGRQSLPAEPAGDGPRRPALDADHDFLDANLRRHGLRFDAVVSSEELRVYKPHVSIFHETCARLGVAPDEAIYLGDSPWADVAGARNAGLRAVWLNRRNTAWPDDIEPPKETVSAVTGLLELPP